MRKYWRVGLAILLLGILPVLSGAGPRDYAGGRYALELNGKFIGWVSSVEGGHATSDVVVEKLGPDQLQKKHLAGVKYEDITITFGTGMSQELYDWIKDTFDHKFTRKNGAIIAADYTHREMSRLTFTNAVITEITLPALDASSKDAAKMTLKLSPETTRQTVTVGQPTVGGGFKTSAQKQWLPANFRLKIDGLDAAMSRVNKIEALTIKQKVTENPVGESRDYEREPVNLEIPNLVITMAESQADSVYQWHEDFVIKGNNGDDKEKSGTLEYLTPDLKTVLFTLNMRHIGIFRAEPDSANSSIRRVKAEMYVEEMSFKYSSAAVPR